METKAEPLAWAMAMALRMADGIVEYHKAWRSLDEGEVEEVVLDGVTFNSANQIIDVIHEEPLSVQVRSCWHNPGEPAAPEDYEVLLCTGGPAVRITGSLGNWTAPDSATLQCQDWFMPWTDVPTSLEQDKALLWYANQFYYGG